MRWDFFTFLADESVKLLGVEAGGRGINRGTCSKISGRKTRCITRKRHGFCQMMMVD